MICGRCKESQATFHLTNIDSDGEKVERHLCERCAVEEGLLQVQKSQSNEVLSSFIASAKASAAAHADLVCENCGTSYFEFRNQGLLGCPGCYDAFKKQLMPLLERAHDSASHHVGKIPKSLGGEGSPRKDLGRLRRLLSEAVAAEDYERAADLRDRIQELETQ